MIANKFNGKFRCYERFVTASGAEILLDADLYRHLRDAEREAVRRDPTATYKGLAVFHGTYRVC